MQLRYISLNIWLGGKLFRQLDDYLVHTQADILALQEVYDGTDSTLEQRFRSFTILKERLGYPYAEFCPAFCDTTIGKGVEIGQAVFSHFPIISNQPVFFDVPYGSISSDIINAEKQSRVMQHVIVRKKGKELNIFNVHGIWGTDGRDNPRRLAMADVIVREVQNKEYVILSGDFNLNPDTESARRIGRQLVSVFEHNLKTTFNRKQKTDPAFASAVVDMVFVSPDMAVKRAVCEMVDVSDHLPLLVELEF